MADFCAQCSKDMNYNASDINHGEDLASLVSKAQSNAGLFASVICEGCGPIIVDHKGYCKSKNCTKLHGDY